MSEQLSTDECTALGQQMGRKWPPDKEKEEASKMLCGLLKAVVLGGG